MNRVVARGSSLWMPDGDGTYQTDLVEIKFGAEVGYFIRDLVNPKLFNPIQIKVYDAAKKKIDDSKARPLVLEAPEELINAIEQRDGEKASRLLYDLVDLLEKEGLKGEDKE